VFDKVTLMHGYEQDKCGETLFSDELSLQSVVHQQHSPLCKPLNRLTGTKNCDLLIKYKTKLLPFSFLARAHQVRSQTMSTVIAASYSAGVIYVHTFMNLIFI